MSVTTFMRSSLALVIAAALVAPVRAHAANDKQACIAASEKAKVEKVLEEGSLRGESQRQSDLIVVKYPDSMTDALDLLVHPRRLSPTLRR